LPQLKNLNWCKFIPRNGGGKRSNCQGALFRSREQLQITIQMLPTFRPRLRRKKESKCF